MIEVKQELLSALGAAIEALSPGAAVAAAFESPKQAAHGDLACTVAMQLAKPLKKNPRELAQALIEALRRQPAVQKWVEALEIAGPGFINLRLKPAARQAVVSEVLAGGAQFGRQGANANKVLVEFVSANPTGPLHVGHGRPRRRDLQSVRNARLAGHARVLLQRCGGPDRDPRHLGRSTPARPQTGRRAVAAECLQRRLHRRHRG